jgi:hypothetical protein
VASALCRRGLTIPQANLVAQMGMATLSHAVSLCDNMTETSCVTAISEQGGKETQYGNDERFCSARYGCDGSI